MGCCAIERISGNSHILHHQRRRPLCILQQLSADWWGRVWRHVGTHQRRLHDFFCSVSGGVGNLLHSSTFWLRGIHWTLNTNISVEANYQNTGTPWTEGVATPTTVGLLSVQCIMGILVWITRYCKTIMMNMLTYCTFLLIWVLLF